MSQVSKPNAVRGFMEHFMEHFARFGFAIKGVVYCIIGVLAAMAPIGLGTRPTGMPGALRTLLMQPVGSILLAVIAFGLLCFGVFQLLRAIEDPEHEGTEPTALARRFGWACNALVQFGLVAVAVGLLVGYRRLAGDTEDEHQIHDWTATALSYPSGRWVVGMIGACIIIYGILQIRGGIIGQLDKWLSFLDASQTSRSWARGVSRFGVAARGVVFTFIGSFLIRAAYDFDPHEAKGLGGTLRTLAAEPHGAVLLAVAALGLVAYGLYDFVLARFRRIP